MPAIDTVEKTAKVIGLIYGLAVGVAQLLIHSSSPSVKPLHFGLYLLGEMWVEVVGIVLCAVCYYLFKHTVKVCTAFIAQYSDDGWVEFCKRPSLVAPLLLACLVSVSLSVSLFYFSRARIYFWREISRKSYVESYKLKIDELASSGRVTDADALTTLVMQSLGSVSEKDYLTLRSEKLTGARRRSDQLASIRAVSRWNPVTERRVLFGLVEAVQVNPQNYAAADNLKELIKPLRKYFQADLAVICGSKGDLSRYRGFAISLVEAHVRWLATGTEDTCLDHVDELWHFWHLDVAQNVLRRSDSTRLPLRDQDGKDGSSKK